MAMREYTDASGMRWTVWSVSSDALHPATRSEDFLRQFASGWLCFEAANGQKRRLIEYPQGWDSLSDEQLRLLCDRAVPRSGSQCSGAPRTSASPARSERGARLRGGCRTLVRGDPRAAQIRSGASAGSSPMRRQGDLAP